MGTERSYEWPVEGGCPHCAQAWPLGGGKAEGQMRVLGWVCRAMNPGSLACLLRADHTCAMGPADDAVILEAGDDVEVRVENLPEEAAAVCRGFMLARNAAASKRSWLGCAQVSQEATNLLPARVHEASPAAHLLAGGASVIGDDVDARGARGDPHCLGEARQFRQEGRGNVRGHVNQRNHFGLRCSGGSGEAHMPLVKQRSARLRAYSHGVVLLSMACDGSGAQT